MSESTYEVNLRNPHTASINLAAFYNSVRLDAGKRIGLFDGGNHRGLRQQPSQQRCRQRPIPETCSSASHHSSWRYFRGHHDTQFTHTRYFRLGRFNFDPVRENL